MPNEVRIEREEIYDMIGHLCDFPFGQICKHSVMCDLLDIMKKKGEALDTKLVKAVVNADDYLIKQLLAERRK